MTSTSIQIWGDSIARGVIYDEKRGRYAISRERCSDALKQRLDVPVENHAKMGATSEEGLAMFQASEPAPGALCAFLYGGNDCDLDWARVARHESEEITARVPLERFEGNMRALVALARERGMPPLLATLPPLHARRYFGWATRGLDGGAVERALGGVEAIYRWQERYSLAVTRLARELGCMLFDARDAVLRHQRDFEDMICADGIHPSDAGHRAIALCALERLENELSRDSYQLLI